MKDVKTALLERTSVRRYEREAVSAEDLDFIYRAVQNTPTSYNGQQFSVIDITDQALKEELYASRARSRLRPVITSWSSSLTTIRFSFWLSAKVWTCPPSPTLWMELS